MLHAAGLLIDYIFTDNTQNCNIFYHFSCMVSEYVRTVYRMAWFFLCDRARFHFAAVVNDATSLSQR